MEPTNEQITVFWERFGWEYRKWNNGEQYEWQLGNAAYASGLPSVTLNSLFKYAVPRLFTWSIGKNWVLQEDFTIKENGIKASVDLHYIDPDKYDQVKPAEAVAEDPALALFWAIWEVMGLRAVDLT